MLRFRLHRPTDLDAAVAAFTSSGDDAAYIAGGTELLRLMKLGTVAHRSLVDVKRIPELAGITQEPDGTVRIGATATHREISRSPLIASQLPALATLGGTLANQRVQNCGTIGGNVAFADPHSDPTTLLLACDARVELAGSAGRREVAIGDFVVGPLATVRSRDEVVVAVRVPSPSRVGGVGYARMKFFERPAVTVAVRLSVRDGAIESATCVVGALAARRALLPRSAEALVGAEASDDALDAVVPSAAAAFGELEAVDDLDGSADYKRHLAAVLFRRAARDALHEAVGRA